MQVWKQAFMTVPVLRVLIARTDEARHLWGRRRICPKCQHVVALHDSDISLYEVGKGFWYTCNVCANGCGYGDELWPWRVESRDEVGKEKGGHRGPPSCSWCG